MTHSAIWSRRNFIRAGALATVALAVPVAAVRVAARVVFGTVTHLTINGRTWVLGKVNVGLMPANDNGEPV